MPELELVRVFTGRLNALALPYIVTGSVACTVYGEPRMTHDVDIVLDLGPHDAARLIAAFPLDDFYAPPDEVVRIEAARRQRGHFNLIHHKTGYKADIYLRGDDPLHAWALEHPAIIDVGGEAVRLARPEYVILRKLEYFREGGGEKHLRDIRGVLEVTGPDLDRGFLDSWIERLGLAHEWKRATAG